MANNPNPEYLSEIMFQEHGTRVLITNPASDKYLNHKKRLESEKEEKFKDQFSQWFNND